MRQTLLCADVVSVFGRQALFSHGSVGQFSATFLLSCRLH